MRFLDISSDLGGGSVGLRSAGLTGDLSVNWTDFLGESWRCADPISALPISTYQIPKPDLLSVQLPSGASLGGLWAPDGTWFNFRSAVDTVGKVIDAVEPRAFIMSGRRNALHDRNGTTFAHLLKIIGYQGFRAFWVTLNLSWLGLPQDANRLVLVASRDWSDADCQEVLVLFCRQIGCCISKPKQPRDLDQFIDLREPKIGAAAPTAASGFSLAGTACDGQFIDLRLTRSQPSVSGAFLADILGLSPGVSQVRIDSVRYVSRNGIRNLQIKKGDVAHSFGPSISAWPLFRLKCATEKQIEEINGNINWTCISDDDVVCRLNPVRSLLLFGVEALALKDMLNIEGSGLDEQYRLTSATVPPVLWRMIGNLF